MATELQKPHSKDAQVETWKLSYEAARETAFNEFMYLMAEQYSMELLIELPGKKTVPSPMVQFWRESLQELSPLQMREGLRLYLKSDRRHFKPAPQDIIENAPQATDKPRKVYNPKCPDCKGSGQRMVMVDSKLHPGQKIRRSANCYCSRMVYDGQEYTQPQLPAAPMSAHEENTQAAETFKRLAKTMPNIGSMDKTLPADPGGPSDEELVRRRDKMTRDLAEHQRKKGAQ